MKLFTTEQIRELDAYTIEHEPISSLDLMERASREMTDWLLRNALRGGEKILVVCGNGNNGGDGLVIARSMKMCSVDVDVMMAKKAGKRSEDCEENLRRLEKNGIETLSPDEADFEKYDIIIDAMFGSGLNRPLEGVYAETADRINKSGKKVIAVDVPSGLYGDDNSQNPLEHVVKASQTMTLQVPKLSFMMPESEAYTGEVFVLPIGISEEGRGKTESPYYLTGKEDLPKMPRRGKFSHKGTYGHALMTGGSNGKAGAVYLSAKACLRSGAGLLSVYVPETVKTALQVSIPEAMCIPTGDKDIITEAPDTSKYTVVGAGCGIGTDEKTARALETMLEKMAKPMVIDADALNIIAEYKELINKIPEGSVLTPHPKEWERVSGVSLKNRWQQIKAAQEFCKEHKLSVVLKGAYSAVVTSNGEVHFNTTGNPGMATAGSGDVLCGIVLGLLSQGMRGDEAAVLAAYIHGAAGDMASEKYGEASMIASDIIDNIGEAMKDLQK